MTITQYYIKLTKCSPFRWIQLCKFLCNVFKFIQKYVQLDKTFSQIIRLCQSSLVNWLIIIQTSCFLETSRHFDLFSKYFPICQIFPICQTFSYLHYLFVVWYKRRDRSTTKCISIENISSCGFVLCQYPQSLSRQNHALWNFGIWFISQLQNKSLFVA